jgi:hypothetical protein
VAAQLAIRMKENGAAALIPMAKGVTVLIFRIDLSGIVFREMNTGVLKSFLYFEDGCEIPFHCSLGLFGPSQSCKTDAALKGAAN